MYRYDKEGKEWKERGIGQVRPLRYTTACKPNASSHIGVVRAHRPCLHGSDRVWLISATANAKVNIPFTPDAAGSDSMRMKRRNWSA